MKEHNERIIQLSARIDILAQKQYEFTREIVELRKQLEELKAKKWEDIAEMSVENQTIVSEEATQIPEDSSTVSEKAATPTPIHQESKVVAETPQYVAQEIPNKPVKESNIEKFIGENLLNKIGILITIIGVSIGVKYSIENDLISPLTRIILGYISGITLLGFGIKLKKDYENYSAVLVSGAIAVMYFITYAAHSFYGIIPQIPAFIMMVIFTVFGVVTAIHYNRQVIAHIGLVGAYAIPFLLSNDSGNVLVLFSYITIINIGILVISYKKYWKLLYCSAFVLTWLTYFSWYVFEYKIAIHFGIALTFLTIFFAIFYTMLLLYKVLRKETYSRIDILLLMFNTFLFYSIGYFILDHHEVGQNYLGLFTVINALIHGIIALFLFKQKDIDKKLIYLIVGFAITFITIAIPVELDGNWVTMLWILEAAILFWIGRTKNISIYEKLSYPLLLLAFLSVIEDWTTLYPSEYSHANDFNITPLFNMNFVSSLFFIAGFGFITKLFFDKKYTSPLKLSESVKEMLSFVLPGILIIATYFAFRIEIHAYWNLAYINSGDVSESAYGIEKNEALLKFKTLWNYNYTFLFLAILSFINIKKIKNKLLGEVVIAISLFTILAFLVEGLYTLRSLRTMYMNGYFEVGSGSIGFRYISFAFVALLLVISYKHIRQKFIKQEVNIIFECFVHFVLLAILSSELIHYIDLNSSERTYKLGLSILWGIYSLFIISLGIWKQKRYLRIGAIILFGITLVKLFFYDIAHLSTISKTIVFVSLGVLLLIISFLYNKYKNKIFEEL
ncbi:DUF2339 domain-containing protein [Kordia algicida OT-1]|uniref:DUF2339 domain-containing protein n=1 Tax=Kordia algicida OT-1 TaxID=391587 RepID=A9DKE7_9FLAO|nr:DUF2339 domain-containing protein [Kordia algicida]EDP98311.1 hypothetical protein KAOT1_13877 [Kordia algicida OT-1]